MGLFHKITYIVMFAFNSVPVLALENISELVSSLVQPKTNTPEIQHTTVQETDESAAVEPKNQQEPAIQKAPADVAKNQESSTAVPESEPKEASPAEPKAPKTVTAPAEPKVAPEIAPKSLPTEHPAAVMPKIMPVVPISPVQPAQQAKSDVATMAAKVVLAPTPIVSKSVSAPVQIVDVPDDETSGLDTLNVDSSGNWLEKRIWYQKGEQLFDVIRTNLQKASDLRMKFVHEVNQVGHKIDEFYENMSFEKGEVDEMLTAVLQDLANQTEIRGGDLSSSERSIKSKVQAEQKQFEVLSKDLKLIDDLDEQIDKTMMKAFKEIDACRGLETRAWNNFKEIGLELDDKKARVLYYEMENFHKNIEQKMTYLQNNLLPYLQNQLVSKVDETMHQIKTTMQAFDSKGLSLKIILKKDEHGDLLILKERDEMQEQELQNAKKAQESAKDQADSWFCRLWCMFASLVQPVLCKIHEWLCIGFCFVQSIFCKIQEWICRLFGH